MSASSDGVRQRRHEIVARSTGIDYATLADGPIRFDHDALLGAAAYPLDRIAAMQHANAVGQTPLIEVHNLTRLVRQGAPPRHGARIFVKDEARNPAGSFKDRRASLSIHHAKALGHEGVVASSTGNYGAAVASQAARAGLRAIVVQEAFDSSGRAQPEIWEKARRCESAGAEVVQTAVGPEALDLALALIDETGFFNASLYTPFSIRGIETLGLEIAAQSRAQAGREPDAVLLTHGGGGMVTGVARGLRAAGASGTRIVAVSVDLRPLDMTSDEDFNRKSVTTGHTGYSLPFTAWPDRADVPRNAARSLRYLDEFVTVTQGEVFYATEALAQVEGLERGLAGNTSLAAAFAIAREMPDDHVLVVSETESSGANKHPLAQLEFARELGIEVRSGDPADERPGEVIVIPRDLTDVRARPVDLDELRRTYLRRATEGLGAPGLTTQDLAFLAEETGTTADWVLDALNAEGA